MVRSTDAWTSAPAPMPDQAERPGTRLPRVLSPLAAAAGRAFEIWLPPVLLVLSWVIGAVASLTWLEGEAFRWSMLPTVSLLLLRLALERALRRSGPDSRPVMALYVLHLALTAAALSALVARWSRTHRVVATFDADDAPHEVRHGDVLLRIAQEALANVARHAAACTVRVELVEDGEHQVLRVRGDGTGFETEKAPRGPGLANMEARLHAIDGRLTVRTESGTGTTITASVPR